MPSDPERVALWLGLALLVLALVAIFAMVLGTAAKRGDRWKGHTDD